MAVQMQDRRLPVQVMKMQDGSFRMKQPWSRQANMRQWRDIPGPVSKTEIREKIEAQGYRVEWVDSPTPARKQVRY
jgi:hypothetical protein